MATGLDELIDCLLSEIALCGTQGANSADFRRFIHTFLQNQTGTSTFTYSEEALGRAFYEKTWTWVTTHPDVRILHANEVKQYSLAEFEAAEQHHTNNGSLAATDVSSHNVPSTASEKVSPAAALLSLRGQLRKRLSAEGSVAKDLDSCPNGDTTSHPSPSGKDDAGRAQHRQRRPAESGIVEQAVFDEPSTNTSAPRLFASQGRIWQALTGHSIDLKKVPTMEFILLSIIAANGADGITQPMLTQVSEQDKRSVPHRTDELARKGYIIKKPVQAGKARTSLCIHSKFVSNETFTGSGDREDVFQEDKFVASGFALLLYETFKDAGVVPTRDIRTRMDVPMRTWNKRAVQGTLIRLDQSGMIKRFRVRKKKTEDSWVICFQVLREPRAEDIDNLGFRRQAAIADTTDELLQDDDGGETLMRDLEIDMLDEGHNNETSNSLDENIRIPPQWTPERLLSNIIFEFTALGRVAGWDAIVLRDRIVGPFWRRPTESYLTRITDDWQKTQPPSLRHLAIIRDTRNTEEKKFIHYVYRTYGYFQEAVEVGEAIWAGVARPAAKPTSKQIKQLTENELKVNAWGFHSLNQKDFVRFNGSATLCDVRSAIVSRKYGPRWDTALAQEIGYQKQQQGVAKPKKEKKPKSVASPKRREAVSAKAKELDREKNAVGLSEFVSQELAQPEDSPRARESEDVATPAMEDEAPNKEDDTSPLPTPTPGKGKVGNAKKTSSGLTLTPEERVRLGLKPTGRLSKSAAQQILAHREETGDPSSLPDKLVAERAGRGGHVPLMTKEERLAAGLSAKGRLGIRKENEIREERGLPKLTKKAKPKSAKKDSAVLSKQQRIALGFIGHGRLHQHFIDALRKEQEDDVPLNESPAVEAYREFLKAEAAKEAQRQEKKLMQGRQTPATDVASEASGLGGRGEASSAADATVGVSPPHPIGTTGTRKRQADEIDTSSQLSKKQRTGSDSVSDLPYTGLTESFDHSGGPMDSAESFNESTTHEKVALPVTPHHMTQDAPQHAKAQSVKQSAKRTANQLAPLGRVPTAEDKTLRLLPGVHVYPDAKRKVTRGRPRNAFIVAIRLTRLSELPKFNSGENSGYDASKIVSLGTLRGSASSTSEQVDKGPDETPADAVPQSLHTPVAAPFDISNDLHQPPRITFGHALNTEARNQPDNSRPHDTEGRNDVFTANAMPDDLETPFNSQLTRPDATQTLSTASVEDTISQPLFQFGQPSFRPVAPSTTFITSAQVTKPSYQSPYATQVQSGPSVPGPRLDDMKFRRSATPSGAGSPELGMSEPTPLPPGVSGPIEELPNETNPKGHKSRGKTAIHGTQRLLRRNIIMEIIDRCGGAFPLQGEIWRPFCALWDQRHGNVLKRPDSSMVHDTLRGMIEHPAFGLKKMLFRVENRNLIGSRERSIVTKKDMTPNHPTVKRLAYGVANESHDKSHQYFPQEIRDLFEYKSSYVPVLDAPKVEGITLDELYPNIAQKKAMRRREKQARRRLENEAARKLNKQVETVLQKRRARGQNRQTAPRETHSALAPRGKRPRLASLNDKAKRHSRVPAQELLTALTELPEDDESRRREASPALSDSSADVPLMSLRPLISDIVEDIEAEDDLAVSEAVSGAEAENAADTQEVDAAITQKVSAENCFATMATVSFTHPIVRFHTATGTFSTSFIIDSVSSETHPDAGAMIAPKSINASGSKKHVRTDNSVSKRPAKKARHSKSRRKRKEDVLDEEFVYSSVEDTDSISSEDEEEDQGEGDDSEEERPKKKTRKRRVLGPRQLGKKLPMPTLLERLTGLTGDPNDPIYKDPRQRDERSRPRPWAVRRRAQLTKLKKEREYAEAMDRTDEFKKLCFTLILASSMSGTENAVDWSIVEKLYARDKFLDIVKVKNLWAWMQDHMAAEMKILTETLQSSILAAYETGKIPEIDNPETYDWAGLLRWTLRSCAFPALPLPLYREALAQFDVDESRYATLNRVSWHGLKIADATRTHLQLQLAFVAPLHSKKQQERHLDDKVLKARSWTRANIATRQDIYNANQAHDKLKILGEEVLTKVVAEFVQDEHLRLRKLKRQLPGRNYTLTKKFAKAYKRPFEPEDFMVATTVKKALDVAFANEDLDKRFYSISYCEEDGSIMAIMSMAAEGQVKLVPQLPPVNDEFGAPLPRLSKWGFCEGDYIHRAIDRNRLSWDIHVVPTENYKFGSPLHSLMQPAADWPPLLEPPLPGKHDPDALLPIWSSIDGQSVTWPWWYRILNLVLQPLYLQPGATAADVFSHCSDHTTELFEVQLVLNWLEDVGAITKIIGGGYQVTHGFWAAFGDRLLDTTDDWFGKHVRRKTKATTKQQWRDEYNKKYAAMLTQNAQSDERDVRKTRGQNASMEKRIAGRPMAQYGILQENVHGPIVPKGEEQVAAMEDRVMQDLDGETEQMEQDTATPMTNAEERRVAFHPVVEETHTPPRDGDIEMVDAADAYGDMDGDTDGVTDEDAEGEEDDAL